ncbi:MAG: hypothetical protein Ct9H300mP8_09630 [Gammaproteobacteria bacterium]|nr:MAG: hypothetical protein Ct9H300mP8_09630 [Gammaproteobacteria bacterium]
MASFPQRRGCRGSGAFFDIRINGVGAHGAHPENGIDPVVVGARSLPRFNPRLTECQTARAAVVSITQFHAGDPYNVIPESAHLSGTVRTFSNGVMSHIQDRMRALAESTAKGYGAPSFSSFATFFIPS